LAADDVVMVPFSFTKNFLVNGPNLASAMGSSTITTVH